MNVFQIRNTYFHDDRKEFTIKIKKENKKMNKLNTVQNAFLFKATLSFKNFIKSTKFKDNILNLFFKIIQSTFCLSLTKLETSRLNLSSTSFSYAFQDRSHKYPFKYIEATHSKPTRNGFKLFLRFFSFFLRKE